jgi:hypothetical protein
VSATSDDLHRDDPAPAAPLPILSPRRPRIRASTIAVAFLVVAATAGLALWVAVPGRGSPSWIVVPLLWIGGPWYVWARVGESNSPAPLKAVKLISGVLVTLIAPFVLCDSPSEPSVLAYFRQYGWRGAGDLGRVGLAGTATLLVVFALADVADMILRLRRRRTNPAAGDMSARASTTTT